MIRAMDRGLLAVVATELIAAQVTGRPLPPIETRREMATDAASFAVVILTACERHVMPSERGR